jgi:lipoprotein-anchoring transpeptidase ErfK/SrfK
MQLREPSVLVVAMIGLAVLASGAAAQTLPSPNPYSYPQGGYRGVMGPDGVMTRAPAEEDDAIQRPLPPRGAPLVEREPLPALSPGAESAPYPIDPRGNRANPLPPIVAPELPPEPQIVRRPPGIGPMPPYDERSDPPAVATVRPDAAVRPYNYEPGLRPPGLIEQRAPSATPGQPGGAATTTPGRPGNLAALPPEDQPEEGEPKELPPQFRRQVVPYQTKEPAGTIIIDTPSTFLYYVNGDGTAIRYGIGVGREGFTWAGTERITRMAEWPDWHPPAEMIERQPYLPRFMAGGPGNPLGARALYLGKTIYRVHGTNQPSTIGKFVSSGCIRMLNEDVEDLYTRVKIGTKVVVIGDGRGPSAANTSTKR